MFAVVTALASFNLIAFWFAMPADGILATRKSLPLLLAPLNIRSLTLLICLFLFLIRTWSTIALLVSLENCFMPWSTCGLRLFRVHILLTSYYVATTVLSVFSVIYRYPPNARIIEHYSTCTCEIQADIKSSRRRIQIKSRKLGHRPYSHGHVFRIFNLPLHTTWIQTDMRGYRGG